MMVENTCERKDEGRWRERERVSEVEGERK